MSDYIYTVEQELKTIKLQRDDLLESLESLIDWVPSETTECRGDKCRELYCESCFGEKTAQETIDDLQRMVDKCRELIANVKEDK